MSELAGAFATLSNLGLYVTKYPSGRYGFVGRVPMELAYEKADGTSLSDEEQRHIAQSCRPALACKTLGVRKRVFQTEQDARNAATEAGYRIE